MALYHSQTRRHVISCVNVLCIIPSMVSAWVSDKHEVSSCILLNENVCPSLTVYVVVDPFLLLLSLFCWMGLYLAHRGLHDPVGFLFLWYSVLFTVDSLPLLYLIFIS